MTKQRAAIPAPAGNRGFTLLEFVVALALVTTVLSLLFGGLRLGARAWDAVEHRTVKLNDDQLAARFIVRQIEQARPVLLKQRNGEQWAGFSGGPGALRFVAPLAAQAGAGGLYWLSFDVVATGEDARRLELSYKLFQTEHWERYGAADTVQTVVLYDALAEVELSYFGAPTPEAPARWLSGWSDKEKLPQLVRLRFRSKDAAWRELIAAPKVGAPLQPDLTPGARPAREMRI